MNDARPAKPPRIEVIGESIPAEIRELPRWVVWSWTWDGKKRKYDKPPRRLDKSLASSTDNSTWITFDEAVAAASFDGVGFVLGKDVGIVGVDLDECRNATTGEILVTVHGY